MTLEATDDLLRRVLGSSGVERERSLDLLLARLHPKLVVWASTRMSGLLKSRMEPEDVAQEIATRVVKGLDAFQAKSDDAQRRSFYAWLWTVAENCVRDLVDHEQAGKRRAAPVWGTYSQTSPSQAAYRRENVEAMLRALDLLAPEDREIIRLVKLQGQSAAEVGQLLGKSPNAVRIQLCRALKELHAHLQDVHATLSGSVPPARPGPEAKRGAADPARE